jgi:hypothetical protein
MWEERLWAYLFIANVPSYIHMSLQFVNISINTTLHIERRPFLGEPQEHDIWDEEYTSSRRMDKTTHSLSLLLSRSTETRLHKEGQYAAKHGAALLLTNAFLVAFVVFGWCMASFSTFWPWIRWVTSAAAMESAS